MIDYGKLNKIRKKYLPFYILSLLFSLLCLGFIVYHLIKSSPKNDLVYYVVYTCMSFVQIIGVVSINIQILNWYETKVMSVIRPMFLDQLLFDKFGFKFSKTNTIKLTDTLLIGKKHHYKTKFTIENDNYILMDVSMLNGLRFNGYALISKKTNENLLDYVITNYRYYYRHLPKGFFKSKQFVKPFSNKCKLFLNEKHTFKDNELNSILTDLFGYKHIGLSCVNGRQALLFSFKEKDGSNMFVPSIFEQFNSNYDMILTSNLNRIIKLINTNLN